MKLNKKILLFFCLSIAYATQSNAQLFNDWEARPNISLKYKISKAWSVTGTYYMYLDHNVSEYDKSDIGAEVKYKVSSWLKVGVDYRHGIKKGVHSHDLRYSGTFDYNLSDRWKLAYRATVQQEFTSLKKGHLKNNPIEYYLRNRLTASYEVTRNIDLYVFTENYVEPKPGSLNFYRQKSGLGAEFEINKQNEVETRFEIKNKRSGKNYARINIGYTYTLRYKKRK